MKYIWLACAEYEDGTSIEKKVPYTEGESVREENETQYRLECWLLSRHEGCTWYSVTVMEDPDEE